MVEEKQRPTKKQREMLTFIENFIVGHGYGPSYREIRAGMGYNSVATVAKHIDNLISRGHLRKKDNSARSLEVVSTAKADLPVRGVAPSETEEKWLVDKIIERIQIAEEAADLSPAALNDIGTLVYSLRVLGFDGAYTSLGARLNQIKKKAEAVQVQNPKNSI